MQVSDATDDLTCAEYAFGRSAAEEWIGKGMAIMRRPEATLEARERGFCDRLEEERTELEACMTPGGACFMGWKCSALTDTMVEWRRGVDRFTLHAANAEQLWYASKKIIEKGGQN